MPFFEGQKRHFPCLDPGLLNTSHWFGCFYVGRLFWRPRARKMSGAIFGRGLCRRDAQRPIVRQPSALYRPHEYGFRALSGDPDARILNPALGLRSKLVSTVTGGDPGPPRMMMRSDGVIIADDNTLAAVCSGSFRSVLSAPTLAHAHPLARKTGVRRKSLQAFAFRMSAV